MSGKPRRRNPTTPGEILREEFLMPLRMTQRRLADHLGYDIKVVNRIVNGRTSVTAEMALKLGAAFSTTPEFWLNAQKAVDLHRAAHRVASLPTPLPLKIAAFDGPAPRNLSAKYDMRFWEMIEDRRRKKGSSTLAEVRARYGRRYRTRRK